MPCRVTVTILHPLSTHTHPAFHCSDLEISAFYFHVSCSFFFGSRDERLRDEEIGDDLGFNHIDSEILRRYLCGSANKENKNMGQVSR